MVDEIHFYTNPMSRGRIARWMLEEIGAPYQTHLIPFGPAMKSPDYLAVNPMGKVPAIRHGDTIVTECPAICAYLADAFPEKNIAPPPGDPRRGAYFRWLFFAAGPLEAAVLNSSLGFDVPPDKRGLAGYGSLELVTSVLENAVSSSPYLCGEQFTAADVYVGSEIGWTSQFGILEKRPAFEAYLARIMQRPAAVRARAIDDEIIASQKAKA